MVNLSSLMAGFAIKKKRNGEAKGLGHAGGKQQIADASIGEGYL